MKQKYLMTMTEGTRFYNLLKENAPEGITYHKKVVDIRDKFGNMKQKIAIKKFVNDIFVKMVSI